MPSLTIVIACLSLIRARCEDETRAAKEPLEEEETKVTLEEIMTRNAQVIEPDATLQEAARLMKNLDVGGLPVCDGERLCGFITDRDIAIRAVAEGEDPGTCKVSDVMSKELHWCYADEDVEKAAQLMRQYQIRRLMVLDRDKKLCGIVSLGDLAVEGEDDEFAGEVLEKVSESTSPQSL